MRTWVAADGSWGDSDLVHIYLSDAQADVFGELSDSDRWEVAHFMNKGNTFAEAIVHINR